MTEAAKRLKSELSRLSVKERADLACFLIHSLEKEVDSDAEAAWEEEVAERMEEIRSGRAVGKSGSEVFDELRRKHS